MFNKKSKEIKLLQLRINELEDILCPNNSHKWINEVVNSNHGEYSLTLTRSRCSKCMKIDEI